MYGWFFIFCGVTVVSNVLEKAGITGLGTLTLLALWVFFTIFANSLYYGAIKKKIAAAQLMLKDESELLTPLLDIKPYIPRFDIVDTAHPMGGWPRKSGGQKRVVGNREQTVQNQRFNRTSTTQSH